MKLSNLSNLVGVSVLAASLAVVPLTFPVQAQTTQQNGEEIEEPNPLPNHTERDNSNDLGWFGLLGLAGLAGLAGRKRHETVHTHYSNDDPNVRVGSTSNYR
ncbi:MAG TPA: hypothetical protein DD379_13260 [Cyanobacteria bacterium UBA11162]|nr:hypothetical protein [Cyanobacteria bacterium UBA11162]